MSWRNQGITGSNNIPLGKVRRFGGDADSEDTKPSAEEAAAGLSNGDRDVKRGRSPERENSPSTSLFSFLSSLFSCVPGRYP